MKCSNPVRIVTAAKILMLLDAPAIKNKMDSMMEMAMKIILVLSRAISSSCWYDIEILIKL